MNEILVVALANGVWLVLIAFVMWTNEADRKKLHALAWQALDLVRDSEKSQSALVAENLTLRHQVADAVYWIEQGNVARAKQVLEQHGEMDG